MNDRIPTTIERHPWLLLPVVLVAALLTAFLRPVPAEGRPAASVPVAETCSRPVPEGPRRVAWLGDGSARRAVVLATATTSGDVGRRALALGHAVARTAMGVEPTAKPVRCPVVEVPAGRLGSIW